MPCTSSPLTKAICISAALLWCPANGQTFTAIMNGENSTRFSFINRIASRTTVTSLQSSYAYPNTITGAYDTSAYLYPTGNSSAAPPWWFAYTGSSRWLHTTADLTRQYVFRNPSYGQTSSLKGGVTGIKARAAFPGTVTGDSLSELITTVYFSERQDWAGQREFGFFRLVQQNRMFFYWSTNSNCSITANRGYSYCRTARAVGSEDPRFAPLVSEHFEPAPITGLRSGTSYVLLGYLFRASWDSTYKFRVEVWDSTYTTLITAFNVDTPGYGATTSGLNGYVTAGILRYDPNGVMSQTGTRLTLTSIDIAR
jgi:hypothetical protein